MALDQYYEKVAGDESADPLVGDKSDKILRAPPAAPQKKRSLLTTVAILALALTVFLAAVAAVSSAVVHYRLPAATEAALKAQQEIQTQTQSQSSLDTDNKDKHISEATGEAVSDDEVHAPAADAPFSPTWNHTQPMKTCGSNQDEARANGCVFDVMMQLWTPPECMDWPLTERFLANGNWTWYATGDASQIYSDEEIRKGDHDVVFVAQSYHRHHCIFAWERLVRAMRNQAPLIEELVSYDHVMHCRHKTLTLPSEGAESVRGVVAPTGYTRCASYDVWIDNNLPENKVSSVDKRWETVEPWSEVPLFVKN